MSSSLFHCYSTGTLIDSNIIISVWDFCSVLFLLTEAKSFCLHLSWQKNPTKKKKETGEQFSGDWNVLKQWRTLEGGKWRKVRTCVCVCGRCTDFGVLSNWLSTLLWRLWRWSDSDNTLHHRSTATLHAALVRAQTGDKAIKDLHTLSFVIHWYGGE